MSPPILSNHSDQILLVGKKWSLENSGEHCNVIHVGITILQTDVLSKVTQEIRTVVGLNGAFAEPVWSSG